MSQTQTTSRLPATLMVGLLTLGCWQIGEGSWIYAKARLAQLLLQRAWSRALAGEPMPKPWPWADTWPVARLHVQRSAVDVIVLAGAHGRTLAFAPGHVTSSALPGQKGTMIVTGHRDTHFRFLKDVRLNDQYDLTRTDGPTVHYRVTEQQVMDSRRDVIPTRRDKEELVLVTLLPIQRNPSRWAVTLRGASRTDGLNLP